MNASLLTPDLLAPGDGKSASLDPAQFTWTQIRSTDDPLFEKAYAALWAEFGAKHEMEAREILAARFKQDTAMRYELVLVEKDGGVCAVRDHTAIGCDGEVVVHLSHLLVAPDWRRSGLAGWMRAVPILTAREVASVRAGLHTDITLVGEMEHDDGSDPRRTARLTAYERAGFLKIDPAAVRYFQPDFRAPAEIDASGGACPLPFQLVIRQFGRESQRSIRGLKVRRITHALHTMYAAHFRPQDMAHPSLSPASYPADNATIALVSPTAVA